MAHEERAWHPNFLKYMDSIIKHPNYRGLAIAKKPDGTYTWVAPAEGEIGQERIVWAKAKAKTLGIKEGAGMYADVMLAIHPTKWKVCQICGKKMSLYYHYPNATFLKGFNSFFGSDYTSCDHISDIWDDLVENGHDEKEIAAYLIKKGDLALSPDTASKDEIINSLEYACRKGNKACLGPGAMSNFPDRFDGFHSYNRCCRSSHDKGRSKENMKSYTRDRRAYEYWSDGNIQAANKFMGSQYFKGFSADHIGPISLGFVHDPRYLQKMRGGDNSSKRDRLLLEDVEKIIETEKRTGVYPMSWYSKDIWEYIKKNYRNNLSRIGSTYRDALKQNMANFMYILYVILERCGDKGKNILCDAFLKPKYKYFNYDYEFNESGEITKQQPRHFTNRSSEELERYKRIAIDAVYDYQDKSNRNLKHDLTADEHWELNKICDEINRAKVDSVKEKLENLVSEIQERKISEL